MEEARVCLMNRPWYDQVHGSTIPEVHNPYQDT